jgi:hypothetical protein
VAPELSEYPLADDRALGGVMEDVNFPESEQDLARNLPAVDSWAHGRPKSATATSVS